MHGGGAVAKSGSCRQGVFPTCTSVTQSINIYACSFIQSFDMAHAKYVVQNATTLFNHADTRSGFHDGAILLFCHSFKVVLQCVGWHSKRYE